MYVLQLPLQIDMPKSVCKRYYHSVSSIAMNRKCFTGLLFIGGYGDSGCIKGV